MKLNATLPPISALLLLSMLMLLSGCETPPNPQVEYRTIKQPRLNLPAELTNPIDAPEPKPGMLYGDSVELNLLLYGVVQECNIHRAAVRRIDAGF